MSEKPRHSRLAGAGVALLGAAAAFLSLGGRSGNAFLLRPPGAGEPQRFLSRCLRCGACAKACPYGSIRMDETGLAGGELGTPVILPRQKPCYLCADLPCVKACPSGALDAQLRDAKKARMGTAVILEREECLSLKGLRCEVCYRNCPLIEKAVTVENYLNARTGRHAVYEPVIHKEHCTGCGICEHSCILDRPAIRVGELQPESENLYEG